MPNFRILNRLILVVCAVAFAVGVSALVPPVPAYKAIPSSWEPTLVESSTISAEMSKRTIDEIPNNMLVLRVQFPDLSFKSTPAHPDNLAHDAVFFDRWMTHLKEYFVDASHGAYELQYYLYPQVLTMPHTIGYYGDDIPEKIDQNISQLIPDIVQMIDGEVDFNQYGGIIIFHAGAGQEADLSGLRKGSIWSTFLTRRHLQNAFDPQNDSYHGVPTNDGKYLTNLAIVPEDQFHDYFPVPPSTDADMYLYSIFGVLAHQFGHIIGLPTLFDNDSSNGGSQGIGNWGLMGTGVWNGNGYVPAQLSAFSRVLLGWDQPIVISSSGTNIPVDHFDNHFPDAHRVYKIPITDTEYFLVENRQQNPDGSLDPFASQPSYSFKLLPDGQQEYYEDNPNTTEDESLLPYFNFMTNSYSGSEWDFFLPGLGGPFPPNSALLQDGSGLLIWHIDENVIAENFTANFDRNRINADASRKGVDLEEADGLQQLDAVSQDSYRYGGPFDSFRNGNNSYFGFGYHNGLLSLPIADSNYGGVPLEIYDISSSSNTMTFSVNFRWSLQAAFQGENTLSALPVDFDGVEGNELFYPMPDGQLYLWKDGVLESGFPIARMPVVKNYVWDGESVYLPMLTNDLSRLYMMNSTERSYVFTQNSAHWASHPVDLGTKLALPLNRVDTNDPSNYSSSTVVVWDKASHQVLKGINLQGVIAANLINFRGKLSVLHRDSSQKYWLTEMAQDTWNGSTVSLDIPADSLIVGIFKAPLIPGSENGELIVQCPNSIYVFDSNMDLISGFPYVHNLIAVTDSSSYAPLSIADVDGNGTLDILIGGSNSFAVVDFHGSRMSPETLTLTDSADTTSAGVYASDIDADGYPEFVGNFSNNRLCIWESDYRQKAGYPIAFADRSRTLPFTAKSNDNNWYIYSATDNGKLFRNLLSQPPLPNPAYTWNTEFADFKRSASIDPGDLDNRYRSSELFVPGELYIYPNPLKSIYNQKLTVNVMPTKDTILELSIYDISGTLLYRQSSPVKAYLKNQDAFNIPTEKLSSGVYIAIVKNDDVSKRFKFSVEK